MPSLNLCENPDFYYNDRAMAEKFALLADRLMGFQTDFIVEESLVIALLTAVINLPNGKEMKEGDFWFAFENGECREWGTDDTEWKPHLLTGLAGILKHVEVEAALGAFISPVSEAQDV